jgi:hypothetical protein
MDGTLHPIINQCWIKANITLDITKCMELMVDYAGKIVAFTTNIAGHTQDALSAHSNPIGIFIFFYLPNKHASFFLMHSSGPDWLHLRSFIRYIM